MNMIKLLLLAVILFMIFNKNFGNQSKMLLSVLVCLILVSMLNRNEKFNSELNKVILPIHIRSDKDIMNNIRNFKDSNVSSTFSISSDKLKEISENMDLYRKQLKESDKLRSELKYLGNKINSL